MLGFGEVGKGGVAKKDQDRRVVRGRKRVLLKHDLFYSNLCFIFFRLKQQKAFRRILVNTSPLLKVDHHL